MTVDRWLEVIEREKIQGTGHVGPTGLGNLARPPENGVCECQVCTRNAALLERTINTHGEPPNTHGEPPEGKRPRTLNRPPATADEMENQRNHRENDEEVN
jgi:hypothetical protein